MAKRNRYLIRTGVAFAVFSLVLTSCSGISLGNGKAQINKAQMNKTFSESEFKDPDVKYRPLPIIHTQVDKAQVIALKNKGYGGVVNNVSFVNYLNSNEAWDTFEDTVKYIKEEGLRMWIYDERQYPSGSAGGQVLKNNPEWQARAIVSVTKNVNEAGKVTMEKPYKHDNPVFAAAYKGTSYDDMDVSTKKDLMQYVDSNGNLNWNADSAGWFVIVIYPKNFYEGTHASSNWAEYRRYINLLKPEPVQKFIDLTYKKYYEKFGDYFGNTIKAFFTDEPSLMGTYFTSGPPTSPVVIDPVDSSIPQYTAVNWENNFKETFKKRRGYDMTPYMPYLYGGSSDEAKKFRWDFYKTTSELVTENYTGQIGKYLEDKKVAMSGHLLLEENIYQHPVFGGNYMQMMSKMQYPGIDLLTSHPSTAIEWCVTTAKLASSTAHFYGKDEVMTEVSNAFDSMAGDMYDSTCAVAVQYAMGITTVNSFYDPGKLTSEGNHIFADTIGRMGYMLDGGSVEANVAVYYPIEGIFAETSAPLNLNSFSQSAMSLSNNFQSLLRNFVAKQIDYELFDDNNILLSKVKNGNLVTPKGAEFKVIVIPKTTALNSKVITFLKNAAEQGVKVVIQENNTVLTENGADTAKSAEEYKELLKNKNVSLKNSKEEAVKAVESLNVKSILINGADENVVAMKKNFKDKAVYMIVNASDNRGKYKVTMNEAGKKGVVKTWDPFTGEVKKVETETNKKSNITSLNIEVDHNRALFITIE